MIDMWSILGIIILIALITATSIWAYKCGKKSGNKTASIILILTGIFIGFTFIQGLCHLYGTSKYKKS